MAFRSPTCCLFKDGTEWREILVVKQLGEGRWFCMNSDWVVCEHLGLAMAEALRRGHPCFFGEPTEMRFTDEQAQLASCRWLRTDARGMPLPDQRDPTRFLPASSLQAAPDASDTSPRGRGQGVLSSAVQEQMLQHLARIEEKLLDPKHFLLEALDIWQKLHLFMMPAVEAFRKDEAAQKRRPSQARPYGEVPAGLCEASESEVEAEQVASTSPSDGSQPKKERLSAQEAASARRQRRLEMHQVLQRACECAWLCLNENCRSSILSFAVDNIKDGLANILQDSMAEEEDAQIASEGISFFLARQISQLGLQMASKRRYVGWKPEVAHEILEAYEAQTGLLRPERTSFSAWGHISVAVSKETRYPVAVPSIAQCQELLKWKKAVQKMWNRASGRAAEDLGDWGRLPKTAQHLTLSFLLYAHFGRLAAVCRQLRQLCHEPCSFQGQELVAEHLDNCGAGLARPAGPAGRGLNHHVVRWARICLALEPRPPMLGSNAQKLASLAKNFNLALCWPWRFRIRAIKKRIVEREPCLSPMDGLDCEEPIVPTRIHPALGGAWYEVFYVEAAWSFTSEELSKPTAQELFSLQLFGKRQERLELFIQGLAETGIFLRVVREDEEVEGYEFDEKTQSFLQAEEFSDASGIFSMEGRGVVASPQRLGSLELQSGDRWGLALLNILGGHEKREIELSGLVVLQNQKVVGASWCWRQCVHEMGLRLKAIGQVRLAAQQRGHGPRAEELLEALEKAPYMRSQAPA